jgi:hypothetical protein
MKYLIKSKFFRSLSIFVAVMTFSFIFSPVSASAEVVEVEGQGDCPGGNDGWARHLIVNVSTGRTITRCVRIEQVPVESTPSSTSTADRQEPETVSRVAGATDPYPNIQTGGEIPGTRIVSTYESSWPQFFSSTVAASWSCPVIYGPNGDPYAGENNGFDPVSGKWFRVCVKNPWREPIPQSVLRNYEAEKASAISQALNDSKTWNAANPGKQKCFQWGPLTNPSGGTESGGVCANPIGVSSGASETLNRTQSETLNRTQSETLNRTQSETLNRTEEVSRVALISNKKSRTSAALELLQSLDFEEKAELLKVTQTLNRRTVMEIDLSVPKIWFKVRATRESSPTITFRRTTNADGESRIRTRKNLEGYALSLSVRKVKLDMNVIG